MRAGAEDGAGVEVVLSVAQPPSAGCATIPTILRAANLPELATDTPDAFLRAAVELATDLERLRELRLSMRKRLLGSSLLDHEGFARNLEAAYRQMWRAWCATRR